MPGLSRPSTVLELATASVDARSSAGMTSFGDASCYPTFGNAFSATAHGRSDVASPISRPWM